MAKQISPTYTGYIYCLFSSYTVNKALHCRPHLGSPYTNIFHLSLPHCVSRLFVFVIITVRLCAHLPNMEVRNWRWAADAKLTLVQYITGGFRFVLWIIVEWCKQLRTFSLLFCLAKFQLNRNRYGKSFSSTYIWYMPIFIHDSITILRYLQDVQSSTQFLEFITPF